jgi:hypothetical protein
MKKLLYVGIGIALTLVVLGVAGLAYAQTQTPPTPTPGAADTYQNFNGYGMMRGGRMNMPGMLNAWGRGFRQGMGRGMLRGYTQGAYGPMHESMIAALAAKLNLSVEDLQAKIDAGQRPYDIAKAQGLTDVQIQALWQAAHAEALKAAVAAGTLTQAQADAMGQRMEQMWQRGFGPGACPGMVNP